jgi:hypothetical protein
LSDSNIPLLTDIVEDLDDETAVPRQQNIEGIDEIFVFEEDDSHLGDTNKHYMPSAPGLAEAAADGSADAPNAWEQETLDVVDTVEISDFENVVAELQTRIASHTYELTDELLRSAFADIEAKIFRQISTHLRQQLPELIDSVVREHLLDRNKHSED